jgi:tetratricopeptide (TPR) repeat protein
MAELKKSRSKSHGFPVWAAIGFVLAGGVVAAWLLVGGARTRVQPKEFSDYAGSVTCRECHREEYGQWAASHHGLAERGADSNVCREAFATPKKIVGAGESDELAAHAGAYTLTTTGTNGQRETFTVEGVIGDEPLVQFLVGAPGGRRQAFSTAWDPRRKEWFEVFASEKRLPGEWGHWMGRGLNWNSMCATCHNTALHKNYSATNDTYRTTMAERSVGCEACHGPLRSHVQWQLHSAKPGRKDPTLPPRQRQQKPDACGACHARRSELTGEFKPGDDFFDHYELAMVDGTELYYPDGQVREEDYEYASFLGSRMHDRGVECTDCHQAHSAKPRWPGNFLCLRCHDGSNTNAPAINPVAHSHHKVRGFGPDGKMIDNDLTHFKSDGFAETGGECVNCHMPQTVFMQRQARHDHGFTIPDPWLTKEYGVPNACNRCHQDKDADWAIGQTDKWYGKLMERTTRQRARWVAEARRGNALAVEPLLKILAMETNGYWKAALINVLAPWSAETQVEAELRQRLSDESALVREKAARALDSGAENRSAPAEAALRARLEDPVRSVRVAAAWSLRAGLDMKGRAARDLNLFLEANADQPGGQLQEGELLIDRGDPQAALAHYRQAAAWDPASAAVRRDLAVLYSLLHQDREALAQLREAVRLEPRVAEYHYSLALALNEAGDLKGAVAELQEATRLNPRHADAWRNLGLARAAQEDLSGALEALGRAETLEAGDARIPYARATVLAQLNRLAEARAAAARALELRPDYDEARELMERLAAQNK